MTSLPENVIDIHLFQHIPADELPGLFTLLDAQLRHFSKDEAIYNQGQLKHMSGVVLNGTAELHFCDENFNLVNLTHLNEGELFGAAMLLAGQKANPMELLALTDCDVLFLDFSRLLGSDGSVARDLSPAAHQLTANLMQEFARRLRFLNDRVRILSQRRLRDKVKVYLQGLPKTEDGTITLPMNRYQLADYLYVDRSALSREFSHMQADGLLEVHGKTVRILDDTFLWN